MYDILAALDNVLNDGQLEAHQIPQHHDTFTQPPGAVIANFPSLTRLQQAEHSLQDLLLPERLEAGVSHTTRMPTTFFTNKQTDGSEASIYTPSPANSTLPLPSPTQVVKPRHSFFRQS